MTFILRSIGYIFGIGIVLVLIAAGTIGLYVSHISASLPDYTALRRYEPPVMTRVHASNGILVAEYSVERRLFLPIQTIPDLVKNAFLAAEDKTFYHHTGVDPVGIIRALITNYRNQGSGKRPIGASTITQQVAKNFFLTNEVSIERKLKELILSFRLEQAYSKDKILELYLNEIYLGRGSYGVAAAALDYFGKSVQELTVAQAAYLAALPKAPNNYNPFRYHDRAVERRNWVIDRMAEDGMITAAQATEAKAEPLDVMTRDAAPHMFAADYFAEEVRRKIAELYGEKRLYGGGLSVRTSLDPKMQEMARRVLNAGLTKFDISRGSWLGPVTHVDFTPGEDWGAKIGDVPALYDVPEWRVAVVLSVGADEAEIGLQPARDGSGRLVTDRERGRILRKDVSWKRMKDGKGDKPTRSASKLSDMLQVGDVVYVEKVDGDVDGEWRLRQVPEVSGALVAMDPHTGRVLALVGGFSYAQSEFNRATQAWRQPGSSFKPFVYSAALDNGYTPATVVLDAPISFPDGNGGTWSPKNYGGKFAGPSTLRLGIERSRNLMTIRLANEIGMPLVSEYAKRFGIYDNLPPYLPMAIGAGETTVLRMTTAYAIIANGGKKVVPTLIDRIQDRFGNTIYKHDERICEGCSAEIWQDQDEPTLVDNAEQILDPMTAYQITSMMEGVVQRGTGTAVKVVGKPIAGKTGTTNDSKDAWFLGFSPDLVAGVFIGYDQPRDMGHGATGGVLAAPIFANFMKEALADKPAVAFRVPDGLTLVPIDRITGRRVSAGTGGAIIEAFKPGTAPGEGGFSFIDGMGGDAQPKRATAEQEKAVYSGTGGLY